ncbi:sensor histidine kinase [Sediminivirga luteola]|nr:sensor histidine kinase [Sediminivirga luteola]
MMTTRPSRPGFMGVFNVITSGVLAVVWLWLPVGLLTGGFSSLFFGLGVLLLVAWVYVMRGAIWFERHRAQAVYGGELRVPAPRRSRREGFVAWLHELWLTVSSGDFWRGVAYHHLTQLLGLLMLALLICGVAVGAACIVVFLNPSFDLVTQFGFDIGTAALGWALLGLGVILLPVALVLLWFSAYLDRWMALSMLGTTKAEELAKEVTSLDQARVGAVDAAAAERKRIERDLHDGAQPRLVALSMTLGLAKTKLDTEPERARELIEEAHSESKAVVSELRRLARGIHPAVLTDLGLDAALSAVAAHSRVPVDLQVNLSERPGREAESIAYFVVSEALTNINKHAGASTARVRIHAAGDPGDPDDAGGSVTGRRLVVSVSDDGIGGARIVRDGASTGLAGLQARALAARGTFTLTSPAGGPTTLVVEIPCES